MKNFETLVELGAEQAIADYIGGLVRVYLAPTGGSDDSLVVGLKHAHERYKNIRALIEEMS
jgi:hypothetical protein